MERIIIVSPLRNYDWSEPPTPASCAAFQVGDGVSIQDARSASGFTVTTGTLTSRVDSTIPPV